MKSTIIIIAIVLSAMIFLIACKSQKSTYQTISNLGNPTITLSKSSCFGKCHVYNLKFYKDGTASYEGIKNVEKIGIFKSIINETQYQSLVILFEAANFQNLDPTYLTGVKDKQRITLGYLQNEVQYQNRAASEELKEITKKIEVIIEEMKWTKN